MYSFNLNGRKVNYDIDEGLLEYLREKENLTSVKNGCSEGACGTCMVLVDDKATKACMLSIKKINGKKIQTIEGLSQREKDVFSYAFMSAGAVQCGFCIPGMVISAKGLFNKKLDPTRKDIKKALVGNICRCTGYIKIEDAILLAAKKFREEIEVPKVRCKGLVGTHVHRIDAEEKILGQGKYAEDIKIADLHYGGAVRTKYPRALIKRIDVSRAEKLEGVVGVFTAKDIPGLRNIGHLSFISDWDALIDIGEETRYIGDSVALIVAETKKKLEEAISLVEVDYEVRTPLIDMREALKDGVHNIHKKGNLLSKERLVRGDAQKSIESSEYVVTHKYITPPTEHAYLEPESATAIPDGEGVLLYTSSQSIFDEQREVSRLLGIKPEKVRVKSCFVGGGFGGKEDMTVQHHAGLLAYLSQKPVRVTLSRKESLAVSTKRHAMEIEMTTACDKEGRLTGMKARILSDTGAYSSLGGPVLQRACTHAAGPYNYQNIDVEGVAIYTNNPPGGAFRGFGVTQSAFATESNINELARMVGISPWEMRYKNAIEKGQELPNGQIADEGTALKETLLAVKDDFEKNEYTGVACAFKNSGIGVGLPDVGRCNLVIEKGQVHIRSSAACIGQGIGTVVAQIVCETIGIMREDVVVEKPDTHTTPNSGTTTASRQTVFSGEASRIASLKLKEDLKEHSLNELEGKEYFGEYNGETDPMGSPKKNPVSHVAYGYATQVVILSESGRVEKVVAAHDVGRAINPKSVEGQIEGGVVMGLGYALTEDFPLKDGIPQSKFGTLGLLRSTNIPEIKSIIVEKNRGELAYGAKGVGEIVCIPTAPAVQGAYYNFDNKFRTTLPLKETKYRRK